jgi:HEAT repeat protein
VSVQPADSSSCFELAQRWIARVDIAEDDLKISTAPGSPSLLVKEAEALRKAPTTDHVERALALVDRALGEWSTVDPFIVASILDAIGESKIEAGRNHAVRLLSIDPKLRGARSVSGEAAIALAKLGGEASLQTLLKTISEDRRELDDWMATALARFDDERALMGLERIASKGNPAGRRAALLMLSKYCRPSSRSVLAETIERDSSDDRYGVTFWLGRCGTASDSSELTKRLSDSDDDTREAALRGLLRLGARDGCTRLDALIEDRNEAVRELARCYQTTCKGRETEAQ